MSRIDWFIVAAMLAALLGCVGMVAWSMVCQRRSADDPGSRFTCGWLGAFALMQALALCLGLAYILAHIAPSGPAVFVAMIVNGLSQPIAILCLWMGIRKLVRGFLGSADYAGTRIVGQTRGLVWYSAFRGILLLLLGAGLGVGCAWPIVRWVAH